MTQVYVRTCQECGAKHIEKHEPKNKENGKCLKCHSIALDYGSWKEWDSTTLSIVMEAKALQ